jgi:hypothetical protein
MAETGKEYTMNKLVGAIFSVVAFLVISNIMVLAGLTFGVPAGLAAAVVVFIIA